MVYHGPSRGCRACKKRRVKCDQTHPKCNNCTKRKVDCPGYESTFDYRHRNETKTTIFRAQQKNKPNQAKPPTPPDSSSDDSPPQSPFEIVEALDDPHSDGSSSGFALVQSQIDKLTIDGPDVEVPLNLSLKPDPESVVLGWYFTNYPLKNVDQQAVHGFVCLLKPLYLSSPVDSPIRSAVAAVGTQLMMLFCHQGSDTEWARGYYAKTVSRMRDMIADPVQSTSDELMLSTMALNFYDMINLRFSDDTRAFHNHRYGALALLKHRGILNHQTEVSRQLTSCVRSAVCHWVLDSKLRLDSAVIECLQDQKGPINKAAGLDVVSLEMIDFQTRFLDLYDAINQVTSIKEFGSIQTMIGEGIKIDNDFEAWWHSTPSHWKPLYVTADEVQPSIKEAGFYGNKCSVYWDLSICDLTNTYLMRRILLQRMVRQLCLDFVGDSTSKIVTMLESRIQDCVDKLCESIPYMLGDNNKAMRHAQLYELNYPSASNGVCTFPNVEHDHQRAAASSGGWICSSMLGFVAKLGGREDSMDSVSLREGQFKWIFGQLVRLQRVFLLSQPTNLARRARWTKS